MGDRFATSLVTLAEIERAFGALPDDARLTPVVRLGESYLKLESLQPVGSFKLRGALTKMSRLSPAARSAGVVAYSSGNHGLAVANAAMRLGVPATIVVPSDAPATKLLAIAREQAEIVSVGATSDERRSAAEALAEETGRALIPPYDDRDVIAGQGTVGFELLHQLEQMTAVVVPVGGGGLISGVAAAVKAARPAVQVIGAEPELAADATESFLTGRLVRWDAERVARTVADGVRTQSLGELGFAHLCQLVDDMITVSEEEIERALLTLFEMHLVAEPAGALALAALQTKAVPAAGAVAVVSGGNSSVELLASLVEGVAQAQASEAEGLPARQSLSRS